MTGLAESIVPAIAWPVAVLLIVLMMRQPLAGALGGILSRVKGFSLAGFAIEMEAVAAKSSNMEAIDELRDVASDAAFADSSSQLKASLATQEPADYAVVNLGAGEEWLTSRLYLLASFAARMRSIRLVVFVGTRDGRVQYLGAAASDKLEWALAARYPWLEIACCVAFQKMSIGSPVQTMERGDPPFGANGRLDQFGFSQLVQWFRQELQVRNQNPPVRPATNRQPTGWTQIGASVWERGSWLTEELLSDILGSDFLRPAITRTLATSNEEVVKAVLRADADLVPVVDEQRALREVIKRRTFLNRLARGIAEGH